jgi:DNA-binding LacI/PurR family transcriptional regulator
MSITVVDVAREAGVSRTTVSNVFNGRQKYSEETRQAVLDAARRLGYRPNLAAKSLITNLSNLIGLILPSYVNQNTLTTSPFYNIVMDGIYSALQHEQYYDLIIYSVPDLARLYQVNDWIASRTIDGILAVGEFGSGFLQEINARSIPVVLIDNYQKTHPNFSYINSDDENGGYLAARRLIEGRYSRIALCAVSPLKTSPLMQKRCDGYRRAMQEAGLPENIFEGEGGPPFDTGKQFATRFIEQQVDAVFCLEDMLAVGVLHSLLEQGVRVGQEFGLVGFDNLSIGWQVVPELTTIDQNIFAKGEIATRTLLGLLKEKTVNSTRLVLPVELIRRKTA